MTPVIKLTYIPGLKEIVLIELRSYADIFVVEVVYDAVYVSLDSNMEQIERLKSILHVCMVLRDSKLNPYYIFKHKSILGELLDGVFVRKPGLFKTFNISCAGEDSKEVQKIQEYVANTYTLEYANDADMEIRIGKSKTGDVWELGVRATARPLSARDYRVTNIPGGLNATIAYAMNVLAGVQPPSTWHTYLNIFSGSATLLIEAGKMNSHVQLKGFDIHGKTVAEAVKNIKKAKLLDRITLIRADLFDTPPLGMFDVITADLPFGMRVGKGEDLDALYSAFAEYCEKHMNQHRKLVTITSEHELLKQKLLASTFNITQTIELKVPTAVGSYLYPRIFVCERK